MKTAESGGWLALSSPARRWWRGGFPALLLVLSLAAGGLSPARAALTCQLESATNLTHDGTRFITASDELPIGGAIGNWNDYRIWFRCQATADSTRWGALTRQVAAWNSGVTWNATAFNSAIPVWTTAELAPLGVGYGMAWYVQDDHLGYVGSALNYSNINQPELLIGDGYLSRAIPESDLDKLLHLGIVVSFRLVKISDAFNSRIDTGAIATAMPVILAGFTLADQTAAVTNPVAHVTIASPSITFAKRTCTTPSWPTIPLPTITPADLPFIGAEGPAREFNLTLNCPTFLGEIGYYFSATHGFHDEANGIIRVSPSSTAQGIGLKLQTRMRPHPVYLLGGGNPPSPDYAPIRFGPDNRYPLFQYPVYGTGGQNPLTHRANFDLSWVDGAAVPMKVSVVRTGDVVPGTFTATVIVVFVYR